MQIKGVLERWPDLETAEAAKTMLTKYEAGPTRLGAGGYGPSSASSLSPERGPSLDYASGPLSPQYAGQRPGMAKAAAGCGSWSSPMARTRKPLPREEAPGGTDKAGGGRKQVSAYRIIVAECKQEVSSFNPVPSRYEDFRVLRGAALLDHHRIVREEVGGALSVFDADQRVTLVPHVGASSNTSGGILSVESFKRLCGDLLGSLAEAGPGGRRFLLAARGHAGRRRRRPRRVFPAGSEANLGERIPFVVSLDLHGILTDGCSCIATRSSLTYLSARRFLPDRARGPLRSS